MVYVPQGQVVNSPAIHRGEKFKIHCESRQGRRFLPSLTGLANFSTFNPAINRGAINYRSDGAKINEQYFWFATNSKLSLHRRAQNLDFQRVRQISIQRAEFFHRFSGFSGVAAQEFGETEIV